MEIIGTILSQIKTISLPWWIAIGVVTILLLIFRHKKKQMPANILVVYMLLILASTVFSREKLAYGDWSELVNLDLAGTWIRRFSVDEYGRAELLLNFCMLLPVGILFPWAAKKGFVKTALFGFGLIAVVELLQLITGRGYFELTDLVDNTVGVMIGYALFRIGETLWRKGRC